MHEDLEVQNFQKPKWRLSAVHGWSPKRAFTYYSWPKGDLMGKRCMKGLETWILFPNSLVLNPLSLGKTQNLIKKCQELLI